MRGRGKLGGGVQAAGDTFRGLKKRNWGKSKQDSNAGGRVAHHLKAITHNSIKIYRGSARITAKRGGGREKRFRYH